ncbi:MAG TPA: hypothetical protein VJ779_17735 [Acetobacteraceae bacterium]|nr:hypothetical protein [Acetobacteraceae bacterium]
MQQPMASTLIDADAGVFRRDFNRASFAVRHNLTDHPLFELSRLAQVAQRLLERGGPDKFVALGARATQTATKFTDMPRLAALADTVRHIDEIGSWMKLSQVNQVDPEYHALMEALVLEIEQYAKRPLRSDITWPILTIFLASPRIVTPYHIDHESNFLLQIKGEKDVCLFDGLDPSVLSIEEIERFYSGNAEAALYREEVQSRGTTYCLVPGTGVHHPPLAPHWVRNGESVSISVSVSFCLRPFDRAAKIHQVNFMLRRLGLRPTPPGGGTLRDEAKVMTMRLVSKPFPRTRSEMLFSGVRRLAVPVGVMRRAMRFT